MRIGWEPITTAPKDGTEVDLWVEWECPCGGDPLRGRVPDCTWCEEGQCWAGLEVYERPTHWTRPPPPPPGFEPR